MNTESTEIRLFDLLESFTFEALKEDDKSFVLAHMSEQEFTRQQKVFVAAGKLKYPEATPLPLIIPEKKVGFWLAPIPLYQIAMAAAAAIIAIVLLWPNSPADINTNFAENVQTPDTVYHTQVVYDTVYKTEIERIFVEKAKNPETVYVNNCDVVAPKRMLEVNTMQTSSPIDPIVLTNNTKPMKNDETAKLLPEVREFGL